MSGGNGDSPERYGRGKHPNSKAHQVGQPGGPPAGSSPGRVSRKKQQWAKFETSLLDISVIPMEVIQTPETLREFKRILKEQALKNPAAYFVKVLIPMMKLVPASYVHDLFASMTEGMQTEKEVADQQILIEIFKTMQATDKPFEIADLLMGIQAQVDEAEIIDIEEDDAEPA